MLFSKINRYITIRNVVDVANHCRSINHELLHHSGNIIKKIENYIEESERVYKQYPYLDVYIISQLNYCESLNPYFDKIQKLLGNLLKDIKSDK